MSLNKNMQMNAAATTVSTAARAETPTEWLLNGALVVAPVLYLAADSTYAVRGWDDATAGVLQVLGAIAYGFVVLRIVSWLPRESRLAASILLIGLAGMIGNSAYGFEAIHMSLGDTQLVDRSGAATLIKPLGLLFPLSLALVAFAMIRLGHRWQGVLALAASIAFPIAHIGNSSAVAVPANVAFVVAFGSLLWARQAGTGDSEPGIVQGSSADH